MKLALSLFLLCCACRLPDGWSLGPYYEQGQGDFTRSDGGYDDEVVGFQITAHYYPKTRREAYRNLAALDVSKAGQLTLRDDHHTPAVTPVTVVVPAITDTPPEPEPGFSWNPFKKVPETPLEFFLLAGYTALMLGFAFGLRRLGILDRLIPSKKKETP